MLKILCCLKYFHVAFALLFFPHGFLTFWTYDCESMKLCWQKAKVCWQDATTLYFSPQGWQLVQLHGLLLHLLPAVCPRPHPGYRHPLVGNMVSWSKPDFSTVPFLAPSLFFFFFYHRTSHEGSRETICLHAHMSVQINYVPTKLKPWGWSS